MAAFTDGRPLSRVASRDVVHHDPVRDSARAEQADPRPRGAERPAPIALRTRRRRQGREPLLQKITPKNVLIVGATGVGETEITRRLARPADRCRRCREPAAAGCLRPRTADQLRHVQRRLGRPPGAFHPYIRLNCAKTIGSAFKHGAGYQNLVIEGTRRFLRRPVRGSAKAPRTRSRQIRFSARRYKWLRCRSGKPRLSDCAPTRRSCRLACRRAH